MCKPLRHGSAVMFYLAALVCVQVKASPPLVIVGGSDNDLVRAAAAGKVAFESVADARAAIDRAPEGAAVLILADRYPREATLIDETVYRAAAGKKLRMFVEYPVFVPGLGASKLPRTIEWERGVVTSGEFGAALPAGRLLAIHHAHFLSFEGSATASKIVLARVAGFDTAVYGLPKSASPLLFEAGTGDGRVLVATSKLSAFVTARYAPSDAWRPIWRGVFAWLGAPEVADALRWVPAVAPSFGRDAALPADAARAALVRGATWFQRSGLVVGEAWKDKVTQADRWTDRTGPLNAAQLPAGDGTFGVLEGFNAAIDESGRQPVRWFRRADCNAEVAMAAALAGKLTGDAKLQKLGENLNGFVYQTSAIAQAAAGDANDPACGLLGWSDNAGSIDQFYGDDNARAMLATIASAAALHSDQWDAVLARCLLGNLRTTGRGGFRDSAVARGELKARGWESYFRQRKTFLSPHFESWLWACDLWAYDKSHYAPFRDRAVSGLCAMMAGYPTQWHWANGLQQERARMLLPLAWLVRVEDTPEHREWLRRIATDCLKSQDSSGAIREEIGVASLGGMGPPASNAAYGVGEASLIQANGDPLADLLYTTNFAFVGLNEAAAATGEPLYREAADRLAGFLCRAQVKSETHPELDGGWFRAFDFHRWEYWASSADIGWGAWSIETGWTQGWIVSVLALREMKTSLWDVSRGSAAGRQLAVWQPRMIPDAEAALAQPHVKHAAVGKRVTLKAPPSPAYAADGAASLVDGVLGTAGDIQSDWLGFQGKDFDATIDLGDVISVREVSARFLKSIGPGIFLPHGVTFEESVDGEHFESLGTAAVDPANDAVPVAIDAFTVKFAERKARFIRVRAEGSALVCPPGHPAAGAPAWTFVDEVMVNP